MSLGAFVSALLFSDEPDTCPHGVPLSREGAGACVRCKRHDLAIAAAVGAAGGALLAGLMRPELQPPRMCPVEGCVLPWHDDAHKNSAGEWFANF